MKLLPLVLLLAAPAVARADGEVTITLTPDGQQLANDLGISTADLEMEAEEQIAEAYRINRVDEFLRAFADATAFSGRGIGVDYASNHDGLMFGVTANVAAAVGDGGLAERDADHPVAGVAPNLALMGGVNLAKWDRPQLTFYGNAFWRKGQVEELTGSITSIGVHAQYKFFQPTKGKKSVVVKWGGFDVTAGLELNRWAFSLESGDRIPTENMEVEGTNGTTSIDMTAVGQFDLDASSVVAPVEATTSLRFLYFFSLYGGASFAFQAGDSKMNASLTGTMTATDPQTGDPVDMGAADITVDGNSGPSVGTVTAFAGLQVNFWKLKLFVQGNFMPVRAASAAFGLRVVL